MMMFENVIDESCHRPVPGIFIGCSRCRQFGEVADDGLDRYTGGVTGVCQRPPTTAAKVNAGALEDGRRAEIGCNEVPDNVRFVWMNHNVSPYQEERNARPGQRL
jgi:hypothetical protein